MPKRLAIPSRKENQSLIDYAQDLASTYNKSTSADFRKEKGQYFTPVNIARYMAKLSLLKKRHDSIKILDPGAGIGIFESAICEEIINNNLKIRLQFDLYENCDAVIPFLRANLRACKELIGCRGSNISYRIIKKNFILSNGIKYRDFIRHKKMIGGYDLVISNPPYFKLNRLSPEVQVMQNIIKGQPNIYVLFMAMCTCLVKNAGHLVILTPRSYCSGSYFSKFRDWFFKQVTPVGYHVFESRRIFKDDDVLQEMLILQGKKRSPRPKDKVIISTSLNDRDLLNGNNRITASINKVIVKRLGDIQIRIPTTAMGKTIADEIDKFSLTLSDLGYRSSTGHVVPFRAKTHLLNDVNEQTYYAPLIWMQNINNGQVMWPLSKFKKPIAIAANKSTEKLRIDNDDYILVKRFSSKEGKRRINAAFLLRRTLPTNTIALENHVNYIHCLKEKTSKDEMLGIVTLLNSKIYNHYFGLSNGSTQVDSIELNRIPLPTSKTLISIGKNIRIKNINKQDEKESLVLMNLNVSEKVREYFINSD